MLRASFPNVGDSPHDKKANRSRNGTSVCDIPAGSFWFYARYAYMVRI